VRIIRCLVLAAWLASNTAWADSAGSPDDQYVLGPDSQVQPGVPEGKVTEFVLEDSKVFPGYEHKWWLYVPAQYDGKKPIALMAFQDGRTFLTRDGVFRVPVVLNNLIAKGQIPVMAAVFVDPGVSFPKAPDGSPLNGGSNRSVEYDTVSADYANFLLQEILPEVKKHVQITDDPDGHGIAGYSSGGICAFNAAWQRPDRFRKVFSNNGSFVNIRGGNVYPDLVRQAERKPIRVFLQDGVRDALTSFPDLNWPAGNKAMAAALEEKGYDHQFVLGEGTHSPKHAAAIFPDAMRWLWRDYPKAATAGAAALASTDEQRR
jgi:enterochelin esterase family protein